MSEDQNGSAETAIALEFMIGVTGHRDTLPSDEIELKKHVTEVLVEVKGKFSSLPCRVFTGLAEGADTLVTEVALDLGVPVCAVLPMPRDEYVKDFEGAARDRFLALLEDDRLLVHELPIVAQNASADLSSDEARVAQYEALMDFLVRRSNIMLALWDGKVLDSKGGTSDVISSFLAGHAQHRTPTCVDSSGPMFEDYGDLAVWIKTPRKSSSGVGVEPAVFLVSEASGMVYSEMKNIPDQFLARWQGFETYSNARFSDEAADVTCWPLTGDDVIGSSPQAHAINQEFIRADQLAMANQKFSDNLFKSFGLIAGAMGLLFLVYAKLAALSEFLWIYVALYVVGFIMFRKGANRHWFSRHLSYRAFAETMRVQYFMLVAGVGREFSPRHVVSLTSVDRFKGFEWLQDAVRCLEPLTYEGHKVDEARIEAVQRNWIEDQSNYFSRKLHTLHAQHERLEKIKALLMFGSVLGALALIVFKYQLYKAEMAGFNAKTWLVFFMGLLPLWLAIWELYQGKMATRELIWQYANQRRYFVAAKHQMEAAKDIDTKRRVLTDLADRALAEIYLWSAHRFHREHEPPAAG